MKGASRNLYVDTLRAIAIIGVIVTHSLSFSLNDKTVFFAWNYLHFVVVGFVWCSGYVTALTFRKITSLASLIALYYKRFLRLYLPFGIYVIVHATLVYFLPHFFRGYNIKPNFDFIVQSFLLKGGGVDIGWLTLLFLQLSLIAPFLMNLLNRKYIFHILMVGLLLFTVYSYFSPFDTKDSRTIAWIPWTFIFLLGATSLKSEETNFKKKNPYLFISVAGFITFVVFYLITTMTGKSQTLTVHKYPPDIFYFSYGIGINYLLLTVIHKSRSLINSASKFISFISQKSYSMFFIHIIVLDLITTVAPRANVVSISTITILLTLAISELISRLTSALRLRN